jgi:hypothetical protein
MVGDWDNCGESEIDSKIREGTFDWSTLKDTLEPPPDFSRMKVKAYDYDTKEEEIWDWETLSDVALSAKDLKAVMHCVDYGFVHIGQYQITLLHGPYADDDEEA